MRASGKHVWGVYGRVPYVRVSVSVLGPVMKMTQADTTIAWTSN